MIIVTSIPFVGNFVYEALFLNYDTSDLNSISTLRWANYIAGLEFFIKHPVGGQLEAPYISNTAIHNYILYNLVNYGIFIGSLLLIVYFKYIFKSIKIIRNNSFQYFEAGPLAMVIIFFVSLFEYTYPFAPGSAIFFPFFLMGQYLQKENNYEN